MTISFVEEELQRLAMENGAEALEHFVGALDEALLAVMQYEPSMAAGISFARQLAVTMAKKFREEPEGQG